MVHDDYVLLGLPEDQPLIVAAHHWDAPQPDGLKSSPPVPGIARVRLQDVQGRVEAAGAGPLGLIGLHPVEDLVRFGGEDEFGHLAGDH